MPNEGFHSVSLPDDLLELVDRVGPRLKAAPKDGRRKGSRATTIEILVREAIRRLAGEGLNLERQVPLVVYDGPECEDP